MNKIFYQQVMPLDVNDTVKNQFGWLPTSVFRPEHQAKWDRLIKDDGDYLQTRRSPTAKYLPSLRYSKFHPHLAEMVIRYWSQENNLVVDPFAGRGCRGIVATALGRRYEAYEVAPSTRVHLTNILPTSVIHRGDGCEMAQTRDATADLVFTCPPYHQLEQYEDAVGQLSSLRTYEAFLTKIEECAGSIGRVIRPGGFCCWVCADWRDGKAFRLFHQDSLAAFQAAKLIPWDVVIVVNNSPFAHLQTGKVAAKRYTSKTHEYLLVFRKPA